MGYAGFDTSIYPGDEVMADLRKSTNLRWCGFYLAPAPSHPNKSWMDRRAKLAELGWGFAAVYVGQQENTGPGSHILTEAQGSKDGVDACKLAETAGFPQGSTLFLDIEAGGPISNETAAYLKAWAPVVRHLGYLPGVYCSYKSVPSIEALELKVRFWIFKLKSSDVGGQKAAPFQDADPTTTGVPQATLWQWAQNTNIHTVKGALLVDLDTASTADPSAPAAPVTQPAAVSVA